MAEQQRLTGETPDMAVPRAGALPRAAGTGSTHETHETQARRIRAGLQGNRQGNFQGKPRRELNADSARKKHGEEEVSR
ncbi:hypothetical protein GXB81_08610 [Paraburkholderia sp. Ac-20336]|uniref:hypothetical protein n=1 Tax=Paraburkholderia sp. Ac-20336 TaxID=2703886 RepID=UPI001981B3BD|nr:hypothetical protein [Paraburkholderia sp. Ac-20336]MBN3803113.1 hypothetical protein [Paraburkholderia sp. Ac-20336]